MVTRKNALQRLWNDSLTVVAYVEKTNANGSTGFEEAAVIKDVPPWWLLIFLIPIFESCVKAIKQRDISKVEYPVIVAVIFFYTGFEYGLWHPMWAIFLTVPVFYAITNYFKARRKYKENNE